MKIIYINHYAGSLKHGMEFRPFYMAREWVRSGHDVTMVAASHSHVRAKQPEMHGVYTHENIEGVKYIWCETPKYSGNGLGRVRNIFTFLWRLLALRSFFSGTNKPDAVIASSTYPLDIFPAWFFARFFRARLIFEVHDLWPLSPVELGGMSRWHPFIMLLQFAEDFAYKHADRVVSMLPLAYDYMKTRGLAEEKFNYIPNGVDLDEWDQMESRGEPLPQKLEQLLRSEKSGGRFLVGYVGAHGIANALDNLIFAAELLRDEPYSFFLIGPGLERENLMRLAQSKGLHHVHFFESVPKLTVPGLLRRFDGLYIGLQHQALFRFGISPNKIMDYMASGRPIINTISAGNDPVREADCGMSVPSENPEALAQALRTLGRMSETERNQIGARGQVFVRENHSYKELSKRFLGLLTH